MFKEIKNFFSQLIAALLKSRIIASSYHPVRKIDDKDNYKRYFRIERDGRIIERILLELPTKEQREEIIFKHFLKFLEGDVKRRGAHYEVVGRDNPWDFTIHSSFNEKLHVEITSVADNDWSFEKTKREEEYKSFILKDKIPLRKLKKFALWFGTQDALDVVSDAIKNSLKDDDLIANPIYKKPTLFISDSKDETVTLYQLVSAAIDRKVQKQHDEKEKTVLIVDNRTIRFGVADYFEMMGVFSKNKIVYPFKEILFYTGYYSDNNGNNSEFSFSEVQLSEEMKELLNKRINDNDIRLGKDGVYYR